MANIGIIGWGIVGQATGKGFASNKDNKVYWYDKFRKGGKSLDFVAKKCDFIFICVPTPMFADGSGTDLSIVDEVVARIAPKIKGAKRILVVKSSVVPGTTRAYQEKYKDIKFIMNPEFLTEMNAFWDFMHPDRIIIGAEDEAVGLELAKLYRGINGYEVKIFITDTTSAELAKFMANTFLATKTVFANEMNELSVKLGINYDDVKKMVVADPRVGEAFLGVTPFGGFGLKCFPKDTIGLLGLARKLKVDLSVLEAAWKKNLKIRKIKDWEEIDGAVTKNKSRSKK